MFDIQPDPLSLNIPGEADRLHSVERGYSAAYTQQRNAYLQAHSCKIRPMPGATLSAIETALRELVASCRATIATADATAPMVHLVPRTWRPSGGVA